MPNIQLPNIGAGIFIFIIWEAFWKGVGLWKAAKKGDLTWFVAMLLINLFGLIPILYLWRTKQLTPFIKDVQDFFKSQFKKK